MNLRTLRASRRAPVPGDVFVMLPADGLYLFGQVIATDVTVGGFPGVLIYVYRARSEQREPVPTLSIEDLLLPPLATNTLPWSRGYFETVSRRALSPEDLLPEHCFKDTRGGYFDEYGARRDGPVEPVGTWGLASFRTIDDRVSRALGIPLAPDE